MHAYACNYSKEDSITGVLLSIMRNFPKQHFYRTANSKSLRWNGKNPQIKPATKLLVSMFQFLHLSTEKNSGICSM